MGSGVDGKILECVSGLAAKLNANIANSPTIFCAAENSERAGLTSVLNRSFENRGPVV